MLPYSASCCAPPPFLDLECMTGNCQSRLRGQPLATTAAERPHMSGVTIAVPSTVQLQSDDHRAVDLVSELESTTID
jgi:hypothetical protein